MSESTVNHQRDHIYFNKDKLSLQDQYFKISNQLIIDHCLHVDGDPAEKLGYFLVSLVLPSAETTPFLFFSLCCSTLARFERHAPKGY